jgi:DNA integrity scanning protein DisA with diadenylate cyclase activity
MVPKQDTQTTKPKQEKDKASSPTTKSKPAKEKSAQAKAPKEKNFFIETLGVARHLDVDFILFTCDTTFPAETIKNRVPKKKVIIATSSEKIAAQCEEEGFVCEVIPAYAFERIEKIKVALASCVSSGILTKGKTVLCVVGKPSSTEMDTCMFTKIGDRSEEHSALGVLHSGRDFTPQVLEAVLNIALSVGYEGFEGSPVGTIFAVGDSTAVMEKSKQLTLNPFQGYSEDEKNILDPKVRDAIKNFCLLDGAFVIREDGVVLAAGRYLRSSEDLDLNLPLGLGTRNAAAMAITATSKAIAFVISKTSGAVRIYKDGKLAIELRQSRRRM